MTAARFGNDGSHARLSPTPDISDESVRILIIDDAEMTTQLVSQEVREHGHEIEVAHTGEDGLAVASLGTFDLMIIDVEMPGMNGFEVTRRMRADGVTCPVLMLTVRSTPEDVARGLEAGADDYLRKPFDTLELMARIDALRRRATQPQGGTLKFGDVELDQFNDSATRAGRRLRLTPTEFRILRALMLRSGKLVTKEELREEAFGTVFDPGTDALAVHVSNLRKKIEAGQLPRILESVRGEGYRLSRTL